METSGWDTVLFTFTPPREVFASVIASILTRWPSALVDDLNSYQSGPEPIIDFHAERLPIKAGHLLFYRDAAMAQHMEEVAYIPMSDGDGPFAVIARTRRDVEFQLSKLEERQVIDDPPCVVKPPDPYPAWLCTSMVFEITVVSPADPEQQAFSTWVLDAIKQACACRRVVE